MAPDFHVIRLGRHVLCGLTDEAIAATMCGFNELRGLWIIAESFPDLANGDFKDGVADKGPGPNSVEQIILGDELARTPQQMVKHSKGFGSQLNCL